MAGLSMVQGRGVGLRQPCAVISKPRCSSQPTTSFSAVAGKSAGLRSSQLNNVQALGLRSATSRTSRTRLQVTAELSNTKTEAAPPVTDATFEELVLKSPVPVLVDFWAPWCGPCRMIAPLIDEISIEYGSKLAAFKLNTDESPGIATEYGIRSIPTVMIFKNGAKQETIIGAVPKVTLTNTVDKYLD